MSTGNPPPPVRLRTPVSLCLTTGAKEFKADSEQCCLARDKSAVFIQLSFVAPVIEFQSSMHP